MAQLVSITIMDTGEGRSIIEAIRADNPGVQEMAMPGAVKLDREGSLMIKAETVSEKLGRESGPAGNPSEHDLDGRQSGRGRRLFRPLLEPLREELKRWHRRKK